MRIITISGDPNSGKSSAMKLVEEKDFISIRFVTRPDISGKRAYADEEKCKKDGYRTVEDAIIKNNERLKSEQKR